MHLYDEYFQHEILNISKMPDQGTNKEWYFSRLGLIFVGNDFATYMVI